MTSAEELEELVRGGRPDQVRLALAGLDEPARKALLPATRALAARQVRQSLSRDAQLALVVARVGTVSGAAPVSDVLGARAWTWRHNTEVVTGTLLDRRPLWLTGVVERLADRIDETDLDSPPFVAVETLRIAAGLPRPRSEAYLRGLVGALSSPEIPVDLPALLRRDPEIAGLVPHLLGAGDVGPLLRMRDTVWDRDRDGRFQQRRDAPVEQTWPGALALVSGEGVLDRSLLLVTVLDALMRGGKREHVSALLAVHDALVLGPSEVAEHRRVYTRLVADGPGSVATSALRLLRAAAGEGLLEVDGVLEAAEAAVRRREKGLATAGLSWLQQLSRAAAAPVDDLARVAAAGLAHERRDVQERALRVLGPMTPAVQPGTMQELRAAAGDLPAVLRPDAEAVLGPLEPAPAGPAELVAAEPGQHGHPVHPPVVLPRVPIDLTVPAEAPVRHLADLAAAVAEHLETGDPRAAERVLDGVSRLAAADADGLRSAMRPFEKRLDARERDRRDRERRGEDVPEEWESAATRLLRTVLTPPSRGWFGRSSRPEELQRWAVPDGVDGCTDVRAREVAELVLKGRSGPLLATPTARTGALAPDAVLERLQLWAASGAEPGVHDLEQAWLRLPRGERDLPEALRRVGGRAAAWLAVAVEQGPPDPQYLAAPVPPTVVRWGGAMPASHAGIPVVDVRPPAGDASSLVVRALTPAVPLPVAATGEWWEASSGGGWGPLIVMLAVPQHREVVAAHLLVKLLGTTRQCPPEVAEVVALLPEAGGPTGPATALAIGWACTGSDLAARTAAADALRGFAAGGLDGAAAGRVLGPWLLQPTVSVGRVAGTLSDAARGDGMTQRLVWELLAGALPAVLGSGRRGMPDLLAVAAEVAAEVGARGFVEGLEAVARPGSTRLASEARRLREVLAGGR